jgi:hypothetical protein
MFGINWMVSGGGEASEIFQRRAPIVRHQRAGLGRAELEPRGNPLIRAGESRIAHQPPLSAHCDVSPLGDTHRYPIVD